MVQITTNISFVLFMRMKKNLLKEIVEIIIRYGAQLNIKDLGGNTPIETALRHENIGMLKICLLKLDWIYVHKYLQMNLYLNQNNHVCSHCLLHQNMCHHIRNLEKLYNLFLFWKLHKGLDLWLNSLRLIIKTSFVMF